MRLEVTKNNNNNNYLSRTIQHIKHNRVKLPEDKQSEMERFERNEMSEEEEEKKKLIRDE